MKYRLKKTAVWTLFLIYIAVMLVLLFFMRIGWDNGLSYAEHFRYQTNLVPMRTVIELIGHIRGNTLYAELSVKNLIGNILLFVPIGIFLPAIWKKQRHFGWFFLTVAAAIVCVELIQLFTMLGSCDIDDLIFNTAGASIGFAMGKTRPFRKLYLQEE